MFWYAKLFFFNHFWFLGKSIYGIMESDLRAWQTRGLGDRVKDLVTRKNKGHVSGD